MHHERPVRLTSIFVFAALLTSTAEARLVFHGTAAERTKLQEMLQLGTFGSAMPPAGLVQIDAMGNVTLTGSPPTSKFGMRLKTVIDDTTNTVDLWGESTAPGGGIVTGGAWRRGAADGATGYTCATGNGDQSIDLSDLMMMPTADGSGALTQQAALAHELWEAYVGLRDMLPYKKTRESNGTITPGAHCKALEDTEYEVIAEQNGGMVFERDGTEAMGANMIKIHYKKKGGSERRHLKLTLDANGQITGATAGLVSGFRRQVIVDDPSLGLGSFDRRDVGTSFAPLPGASELSGAQYLFVDGTRLFVSLPLQGAVVRLGAGDVVEQSYQDADELDLPQGVVFDPATGELFVADGSRDRIAVFAEDGTFLRALESPCLALPAGIDLDGEGNLFIASHGLGQICHLSADGALLNSFTDVALGDPAGLAFEPDSGLLFVVNNSDAQVVLFEADGTFAGIFADGMELSSPWGIAIDGGRTDERVTAGLLDDPVRSIVVANSGGGNVVVYNLDGSVDQTLAHPGASPTAVAVRVRSAELFEDGFETGDLSAWSSTTP